MNVLQNLIELYDHLSSDSTYRAVVSKILMNLRDAAEANVYELAELTSSSRTTIWRMLQMLGYEHFSDFHHALRQAVRQYTYYNRIVPSSKATEEDVTGEIIHQLGITVKKAEQDLVPSKLVKMAERIAKSSGLFFFFPYRTAAIKSFQQNLAMAGIESGVACLYPDMLACAKNMQEGSVALCMTIEYAETQDMTAVFEALEERGVYTVIFSGGDSRYDMYAKEQVCKGDQGSDVLSGVVRYEAYIFALSEVFRRMVLD